MASLSTTGSAGAHPQTSTGATARGPSQAALAACLTSHGFAASVGSTANPSTLSIAGVVVSGNVDASSPQFQAAMQACRKFLPGGGPPALTPAQKAEVARAMASFAACMRANGVPSFPDPNSQGMFTLASLRGFDRNSPLVQSAFKACESLEPTVGPRLQL